MSIGSGVFDRRGSKNRGFPLTRRVALTTVLHYRADCDELVDIDVSSFFASSDVLYTTGNCKNLAKPRSVSVRDGNMFSKRIVNVWNSLPDSVVSATSVMKVERLVSSQS